MKKYVIKSEISHMPIVDMATGRVVARSYSPYFNKKTLSLEYLALSINDDGNENMFIPFSSLCFINDVCTMIKLPEDRYIPDKENCFGLIGSPLTAKVGALSLFDFGSIAQADVDENGDIVSITLDDGNSFPIGRDGTAGSTSAGGASASEALRYMNTSLKLKSEPPKVTETVLVNPVTEAPKAAEEAEKTIRVPEKEINTVKTMPEIIPAVPKTETQTAPVTEEPVKEEVPVIETPVKKEAKHKFRFTLFAKYRKYVAPIVAMLIFFVLYCLMQFYVIKSNTNWG